MMVWKEICCFVNNLFYIKLQKHMHVDKKTVGGSIIDLLHYRLVQNWDLSFAELLYIIVNRYKWIEFW